MLHWPKAHKLVWTLFTSGLLSLLATQPTLAGPYETSIRAYQQGEFNVAVSQAKSALDDPALPSSKKPYAHYYLAESLVRLNQLAEAQTHYQQALALAPHSQVARLSELRLSRLNELADRHINTRHWTSLGSAAGRNSNGSDKLYGLDASGPNYFDEIRYNGKLVRWSLLKMPLRLYIEKNPQGLRHFSNEFARVAYDAIRPWENALGKQLYVISVPSAEKADIIVNFTNGVDQASVQTSGGDKVYTAGLTEPVIFKDQLERMDVRIATLDVNGRPHNADDIYEITLHEYGHALGLMGHSPNPGDIMHAQSGNAKQRQLSPGDIATIRSLYSATGAITNLAPDNLQNATPEALDKQWVAIKSDVTKREVEAKDRPTTFNWTNLANAYLEAGRWLDRYRKQTGQAPPESPMPWIDKALEAATTAIKIDDTNSHAFQTRSIIYEVLDKAPLALVDANRVVQLRPDDPQPLLQRAWLLAKLGKTVEAKNTLSNFLSLAPNGRQDPFYQKIINTLN